MKAGSYHGLPHKPYVLVSNRRIEETDVYNWLYCTARIGMDCSGFVWHALTRVAENKKVNLGATLRRALGAQTSTVASFYAGTKFYNSKSTELTSVDDKIKNLKPAEILLFRAKDGEMSHSAIIQSVDFENGIIRYIQNTDEAPLAQRGPHESFIYFEVSNTDVSLKDEAVRWTQKRRSPFEGERVSTFADDGQRYRAYGGGRVVRLNIITRITSKYIRGAQTICTAARHHCVYTCCTSTKVYHGYHHHPRLKKAICSQIVFPPVLFFLC
jgi:hypothetical protein